MSERFDANPNNIDIGADLPHASRYFLARGFIKPGEVVVDAACGTGYGSALLTEVASKIISLDYLDTFNPRWNDPKIEFHIFDLEKEEEFPKCDAWVSLETIEHLYDPQAYVDKVVKAAGRIMIFSSDNHESVGLNEHHHSNVFISNMRHYMGKHIDTWMEYNSFFQGREDGQWVLIFIRRDAVMFGAPDEIDRWQEVGKNYHFYEREDMHWLVKDILESGVEDVTEFAVGSGMFPVMLRKAGFTGAYMGTDYSNNFLQDAQNNNPSELFTKVNLNDPIDLIKDGTCEACVVIHGLDYVADYKATLTELKRITNKFIYIVLWRPFTNESDSIKYNKEGRWNVNTYNRGKFYQTLEELKLTIIEDLEVTEEPLNPYSHIIKLRV